MNTELVDVLKPPDFSKSGIVRTREEAYKNGDWLGTFNLWIIQDNPIHAIIYQQRSPKNIWEPGKLAVVAGGHYLAGEDIREGMREAEEELGKKYYYKDLVKLGRRIYVGLDKRSTERRNIVDVFMIKDNSPLSTYRLDSNEVYSVCSCPIAELVKMYTTSNYSFAINSVKSNSDCN